jgi:DNA polymerase
MESLEEIAQLVRNCIDCPLHQGRTNAVPGEGSPKAEIMFIGEGPGYQEDRQGRPFVGPAGQFLEELLGSIGLRREQVFIANMVKCRPPQNRDPQPAEISACSKYLDRQIELINPHLIVTLGRFSLARFFPGESISRARGRLRQKDGRFIYPIMHPAAALHRQELRAAIVQDFKAIPQALETTRHAPAAVAEARQEEEEPPPGQLALF